MTRRIFCKLAGLPLALLAMPPRTASRNARTLPRNYPGKMARLQRFQIAKPGKWVG